MLKEKLEVKCACAKNNLINFSVTIQSHSNDQLINFILWNKKEFYGVLMILVQKIYYKPNKDKP